MHRATCGVVCICGSHSKIEFVLKLQEQIAREKMVSGRVQIQVWYHAERSELVVSLMAGDDLALRDEAYGHGNLPEAYAKVRILPKW